MRQFTTPEQTAKLIELGFDKPKGWCAEGISSRLIMYKHKEDDEGFNYSIGELIEMLPPTIPSIKGRDNFLLIEHFYNEFRVRYGGRPDLLLITGEELVDVLCRMIFMLKQYKLL